MQLNEIEKEFGPIILKEKSDVFLEYIDKLIMNLTKAISKVKDKNNYEILNKRIKILKEIILWIV